MSKKLSEKSRMILHSISKGNSYAQIVDGNKGLSYIDIFKAAQEALRIDSGGANIPDYVQIQRANFPNAYMPWSKEDDERLISLVLQGTPTEKIAKIFDRQPSAIRSRITKVLDRKRPIQEILE